MAFVLAPATLILIALVVVVAALQATVQQRRRKQQCERRRTSKVGGGDDLETAQPIQAPGPTPLPFIGNALDLAKYGENPYKGFSALGKKYGSVYSLYLGAPTVVVGTFENIKEVLITKGSVFDARPDMLRFKVYFHGDRDHSLALCDFTELHRKRMALVRNYLTFRGPKSSLLENFEENIASEMPTLTGKIDMQLNKPIKTKALLSYCAMNIFTGYMCSKKFDYEDESFKKMVRKFDFIFEDINNGHVTDAMPWLAPLFRSYFKTIDDTTKSIRDFILKKIFNDKFREFKEDPTNVTDLLDSCFDILLSEDRDEKWDWETVVFIVEDLLGGSCAISNMVMRFLGFSVVNPEVMEKLQEEIDAKIGRDQPPTLSDRANMMYNRATLYEALRWTSSPVVPHVATQDATIGGFLVEKGSTIIINNYEMNHSPDLWDQPEKFKPERFIADGCLKKPAYFIPFSTGKRSCVGYRVVMDIAFIVTTTILQRYNISLPEGVTPDLPRGKISLTWDSFDLIFSPRQ